MFEREKIELNGIVEDITFRRPDTGFTVLDIESDGELITVVGTLPSIDVGESVRFMGYWDFHASFGRQFRAEMCEHSLPSTSAQMLKYLSSRAVKGIGPSTASKIVEKFGENSFDIIENHPDQLAKIRGISIDKAHKISMEFKNQFQMREVITSLERFGMTAEECISAFKFLGSAAADRIKENPYILCNENINISFERVENIAEVLPSPVDISYRIDAGILHVIKHNLLNGHTCLPRDKMIVPSSELLSVDNDTVDIAIDGLIERGELITQKLNGRDFLFLPYVYRAEHMIADRINIMLNFPLAGKPTLDDDINKIEREYGIEYASQQRLAIKTAIQKGILILTGGPGTGKTTTVNGILKLLEKDKLRVVLTAPTGRAAKRMSEVTGREAKTIHRLLEVEWSSDDRPVFKRNMRNPIDADAVIVDELSMVDIFVFSNLLDALPLGCRLIMVGDSDQLPPVGAGNVLHDLIKTELLPVVELKEVFRQAMESLIVTNAHKIVNGENPVMNITDNDFFYMERNNPVNAVNTVVELCARRLTNAYEYSPFADIQVICPSRKGDLGTVNINRVLQSALNPPAKDKKEINVNGHLFREGDKVMQIKNNYNVEWTKGEETGTGIFNGDIGILTKIDSVNGTLLIIFDDREALFSVENAMELELAYAITVHKSQGSEFPAVIIPALHVPYQLSYRNLLYTAVTRAKNLMIIVGNSSQVFNMVANNKKSRRYSGLYYFLTEDDDEF